jgi:ATP-dependent protease ClpP protease subunit
VRKWSGRRGVIALACMGVMCGGLARPAAGDRLVFQDGKTVQGEVVAEDAGSVTVEVFIPPGYTINRRLNKAQVKTWERPPHDGAPYVLIPIFGAIGDDVTVESLRAGIEKARAANPKYIVMAIDSPGGDVAQMVAICELLTETSKQFPVVAYVKQAYSATAVIAMTCPQVVMRPGGSIGATVPFRMTDNGPEDVDAKFRSVIEARMRAATANGGHADLLIRGMSEMDLELFLAEENGKPVLRTSGPGTQIKSKKQILCMTSDEAVKCGLSGGIAADMAELGRQIAGGPWHECTRRPWNVVVATDGMRKERERELAERQFRFLAKQAAIERVRPEWDAIERRVALLQARMGEAHDLIMKLAAKRDAELKQINIDYQKQLARAAVESDSAGAAAHAQEVCNTRSAAARQRFDDGAQALQTSAEAAGREAQQLRERQKELLASLPQE